MDLIAALRDNARLPHSAKIRLADEIERLRAEVEAYRLMSRDLIEEVNNLRADCDEIELLKAENVSLKTLLSANEKQECDEIKRLRAAILRYRLMHDKPCAIKRSMRPDAPCECGASAIEAALRGEGE